MRKKLTILLLLLFFVASAQNMQTLTYFQNDTLKLDMDLFIPEKTSAKTPLFIYVHGGGFASGDRKAGHSMCKFLAQNGIAAATISYTLYMKNKRFSCDGVLSEKIKAFQYGVNDLWLATTFLVRNRDKFNVNTNQIFIGGTSAGGETVLHAAYWDRKIMSLYNVDSLDGFKYAGMISGAGAIMDLNLITSENKIPTMLFHGSGDVTVPYGTAAHHYCPTNASGWLMLFGSYSIYNHLISLNGTITLFTFCGGGHEFSHALFEKEQHHALNFIKEVVSGKKFQANTIIPTGKKNEKSAVYRFCD